MPNNNFDPFNHDDEDENEFGFNIDPESLSGMISDMFQGQGISGLGISGMNQGPMEVAQKVAADIAARENVDEQLSPEDNESEQPGQVSDPMAEIMQLMHVMAARPGNAKSLDIDSDFSQRCEEIYPAAQNYISNNTQSQDVTILPLVVTDRVSWTKDYIDSLEGPLKVAAKSLNPTIALGADEQDSENSQMDVQGLIAKTIGPMLFGVQAGTMVGFLSHRAYGDDDVLLPTKLPNRVGVIASAVQQFAREWSIPVDEAILYFLILQTLRAHIRNNGWLTERLNDLCTRYVGAYELNPYKLEELMSDVDMSSQESMMAINVTPQQMFEALRTDAHDILDEEIGRISSLHDAYVDWVLHKDLQNLLPNYEIIKEARKRITVTTSDADRFVEQLFGVAISPQYKEQANDFLGGVIERDGQDKLHMLWENEEMIPTHAEFLAPGLWLARLEMLEL